jgi:FKBP-type peptidyl-prolyl cis-trans isomerase FklB
MRFIWTIVLSIFLTANYAYAEDKNVFKDKKEKLSYSMGMDIGKKLKGQSIEIDPVIFSRGLKDAYTGSETLLTDEDVEEILKAFQQELVQKRQERAKKLAEENKEKGEAFLQANKKKEGVVTLPSGLQYEVLKEGTGKTPAPNDKVKVHYVGSLIDGKEFDSSHRRGQPATFPVKGVIKGWTEALQLMKEGAKWKLYVPPSLAYEERGAGNVIGPNETLIFEVDLIAIQ